MIARIVLYAVLFCLQTTSPAGADKANYDPPSLGIVLKAEGGYSNHSADPGGVTLNGVTQARYDGYRADKGLRRQPLTKAMEHTAAWHRERAEIYRHYYADHLAFDALPRGVDYLVFDFGVNAGNARGWGSLMKVLGLQQAPPYAPLRDVLQAIARAGARAVINRYGDERRRFYNALAAQRPSLAVFLRGWLNRESHSRRIALNMNRGISVRGADSMPMSHLPMGKAYELEEIIP
jgi:lysozyme family protein